MDAEERECVEHLSTDPAELLAGHAREAVALAAQLAGRGRKCLAVDLDGTLWGGVPGGDGAEGIEVCEGYHGEAFRPSGRRSSRSPHRACCWRR